MYPFTIEELLEKETTRAAMVFEKTKHVNQSFVVFGSRRENGEWPVVPLIDAERLAEKRNVRYSIIKTIGVAVNAYAISYIAEIWTVKQPKNIPYNSESIEDRDDREEGIVVSVHCRRPNGDVDVIINLHSIDTKEENGEVIRTMVKEPFESTKTVQSDDDAGAMKGMLAQLLLTPAPSEAQVKMASEILSKSGFVLASTH